MRLLRNPLGEDFALNERLPSFINCRADLDGVDLDASSCLSENPLANVGVDSPSAGTKNDSCFGDPGSDMLVDVL